MKILHVKVESDDGWYLAQGLEEPGVITQGRTLDELLFNVRDAARTLLQVSQIHVEMIFPPDVVSNGGKKLLKTARRKAS